MDHRGGQNGKNTDINSITCDFLSPKCCNALLFAKQTGRTEVD
jgi:hypothetical protein